MSTRADHLRLLLAKGPIAARTLTERLGISQPTLSRTLAELGPDLLRMGAARATQYALRDPLRGFGPIPVHCVDAQGQLTRLGVLAPIRPDGFLMTQDAGQSVHSDGLPWWLLDMRPQGFLGRAYARRHSQRLGLSANVAEWSDSHALRALLEDGHDVVGNLLLGDLARAQFLSQPAPLVTEVANKADAYARLAQQAMQGDMPGSSAAGEQPKFTVYAQTPQGPRHLLVKFSLQDPGATNPVAQRWRDLLLAEHHALQTLRDGGLSAASSWVQDHAGQRFLELERFDRVGSLGRCGLVSLSALDAEFVGHATEPWPVVVDELARQKVVTQEAAAAAQRLFAFGRLIGNTDMHMGNLSFLTVHGQPYDLAPAYDMLPMAFAPGAGGSLGDELAPVSLHPHVPKRAWVQMLGLARQYLQRLQTDQRFSQSFAPCLAALKYHLDRAATTIDRLG